MAESYGLCVECAAPLPARHYRVCSRRCLDKFALDYEFSGAKVYRSEYGAVAYDDEGIHQADIEWGPGSSTGD